MITSTVVLGVTGGIAAYKALDIVSGLKKENIEVHVIMTNSATKFVTPLSFQALSHNNVVYDIFSEPKSFEIQHISLAQKADIMLIAPASADIIGKIANGIADDMLSTTIMATKAEVIIAPAMNTNMYENKIVQSNIKKLKEYGYKFIEPDEGRLACGDIGKGKLASTSKIIECIESVLTKEKDFKGKKILITAGPTREDIDPVRYVTNRSSGKMGYAIAKAARNRGAEVLLISGPTNLNAPIDVGYIEVYSADDMYNCVMQNYRDFDIIIMAAAVADFTPFEKNNFKIKKTDSNIIIELSRTHDILLEVSKDKGRRILIGFAAETDKVIDNAIDKIKKKNLDMIIANDVTREDSGFNKDTNKVDVIYSDGRIVELPPMNKYDVACSILNLSKEIKR